MPPLFFPSPPPPPPHLIPSCALGGHEHGGKERVVEHKKVPTQKNMIAKIKKKKKKPPRKRVEEASANEHKSVRSAGRPIGAELCEGKNFLAQGPRMTHMEGPTTNGGMEKWKLEYIQIAYTFLHVWTIFMLSRSISASERSQKFIKRAMLVGGGCSTILLRGCMAGR